MRNVMDLSLEECTAALASMGHPPYRARQVWQWIYARRARRFGEMSSLPAALREGLDAAFAIERLGVREKRVSSDGTTKWLLELTDGEAIEAVCIPEEDRRTLCLSSQVGCAFGCVFCRTGLMGLKRSLTAGEILAQVFTLVEALGSVERSERSIEERTTHGSDNARGQPLTGFTVVEDSVMAKEGGKGDSPKSAGERAMQAFEGLNPAPILASTRSGPSGEVEKTASPFTHGHGTDSSRDWCGVNLVFMGMGEPADNWDAVRRAILNLVNKEGVGISPRRITVSTVGVVPALDALAEIKVNVALSVNAVSDDLRSRLMPVNRKYPLADLLTAARRFREKSRSRLTFEYVLLRGINDSDQDAKTLGEMAGQVRARVNVIPFNASPDLPFESPTEEELARFAFGITQAGVRALVRKSRGREIMAACGQLAAAVSGKP